MNLTVAGLKQALATVNDYNPLMKDFPLDDLLSATELDKIRSALVAIFSHLKKIRNTKYPIQRALRLVEAISRDLSTQLLKVCKGAPLSLQLGIRCSKPDSRIMRFLVTVCEAAIYMKLKENMPRKYCQSGVVQIYSGVWAYIHSSLSWTHSMYCNTKPYLPLIQTGSLSQGRVGYGSVLFEYE